MTGMTSEAFDSLFDLARGRGTARNALLDPKNILLAATLCRRDKPRWLDLLNRLSGWTNGLPQFKAEVTKLLAKSDAKRAREKADKEAKARLAEAEERGLPLIAEGKPVRIAEDFRATMKPHLVFADGMFLEWEVNAYRPRSTHAVRAAVQEWMARGVNVETGEPCHPVRREIDDVMDALRSVCLRSEEDPEPPSWNDYWEDVDPNPTKLIAATNGLVDLVTFAVYPNTPRLFTRNGLDYAFDPSAPQPLHWLAFLESVWPEHDVEKATAAGNRQNKDTIQEVMGHLLTGETKYQKIFLLMGVSRGGKGVISRLLEKLVGMGNVVTQSASKLATEFGMKALIGKQVLIIPDLRLGRNSNLTAGMVEHLLSISGEDTIAVGRKYLDDWHGRLRTRIVLASNMELVLPDKAGALHARLLPLVFKTSFAGREDVTLEAKLASELPSILNWSLAGLRRLEERVDPYGHPKGFIIPPDGQQMLVDVSRQGSTVQQFIRERCVLKPGLGVPKTVLFGAFEEWCEEMDLLVTYVPETFAKELRVASGYLVEAGKRRVDGVHVPHFVNVSLIADSDDGY